METGWGVRRTIQMRLRFGGRDREILLKTPAMKLVSPSFKWLLTGLKAL